LNYTEPELIANRFFDILATSYQIILGVSMSTAREIVKLFGGQSALAELIGKGQSTVAYWVKAGVIPD
jgi:hypothetical protein